MLTLFVYFKFLEKLSKAFLEHLIIQGLSRFVHGDELNARRSIKFICRVGQKRKPKNYRLDVGYVQKI